jgi:hypothetical protein
VENLALAGSDARSDSSRRHLPAPSQTHTTGASILRNLRSYRMGAVTADEPPILMSDHGRALDTDQRIWAANH